MEEYRRTLLECDKSSVQEYDKAVMTLSGGALGVSFSFLQYIGKPDALEHLSYLLIAWGMWGLSITFVLFSHYASHLAMRRALKDLNHDRLNYDKPGQHWDIIINVINPVGGGLFFVGLVFLLIFVSKNF